MHTSFFTIDNDNAVIRLYRARVAAAGLDDQTIRQLHTDLEIMAQGISMAVGVNYIVVVV